MASDDEQKPKIKQEPGEAPADGSLGALTLVPLFYGDSESNVSVTEFLETLEQVRVLQAWSEARALGALRLLLRGEARTFLSQHEGDLSYDQAKTLLNTRFASKISKSHVLSLLTQARQRPRETPRAYFMRLVKLKNKAEGVFEGAQKAAVKPLIESTLVSTLKRTVYPERVKNHLIQKGVETLQSALEEIEAAEKIELDYYSDRGYVVLRWTRAVH